MLTSRFDLTIVIVEKVEGSAESAMQRILNEREGNSERKCLIQWEDGSIDLKLLTKLSSCKDLVTIF